LKKENLIFLLGGFAFGVLVGIGVFNAYHTSPGLQQQVRGPAQVPAPAGPMAPTQTGSNAEAPMVAEINALKRRLQENPNDLAAATRLANLHHDVQMWDQAVVFYEKAIALSPDDPDLLTDLGVCYRALQRFGDALEMFSRAQASDPDHWQSLFNAAVVAAFDLGDYDRALKTLEPLERKDPQPPRVPELRQAIVRAREEAGQGQGSP
jgi:cytochrome c-type biogenesis protein CcmH/NrfG